MDVDEENKAMDTLVRIITCGVENVQAASVDTFVRFRIIGLLSPRRRPDLWIGLGDRAWRRVAAHSNIPIHKAMRERWKAIASLTDRDARGYDGVREGVDFEITGGSY